MHYDVLSAGLKFLFISIFSFIWSPITSSSINAGSRIIGTLFFRSIHELASDASTLPLPFPTRWGFLTTTDCIKQHVGLRRYRQQSLGMSYSFCLGQYRCTYIAEEGPRVLQRGPHCGRITGPVDPGVTMTTAPSRHRARMQEEAAPTTWTSLPYNHTILLTTCVKLIPDTFHGLLPIERKFHEVYKPRRPVRPLPRKIVRDRSRLCSALCTISRTTRYCPPL